MQCAHTYIYGVEVNNIELLKKIFSHNAMKEKVDLNGRESKRKYLGHENKDNSFYDSHHCIVLTIC